MSDQTVALRYEATVKDDASGAIAKILGAAEKLDAALLKVTKDQKSAADAAVAASNSAAAAEQASSDKRQRAILAVSMAKAKLADQQKLEAERLELLRVRGDGLNAEYKRMTASTEGASAASGRMMGKVQGLGVAANVAGAALDNMGVQGGGAAASLAGKLSALAATAGPVAIAVASIGVAVWGVTEAHKALHEESKKAIADAQQWAQTSERSKSLQDAAAAARRASDANRKDTTPEIEAAKDELASIKGRLESEDANYWNLRAKGEFDAAKNVAAAIVNLNSQKQNVEKALTALTDEESRKRAEITRREAQTRAQSFEKFGADVATTIRKLEEETAALNRRGSGPQSPLDATIEQIQRAQMEKVRAETARQIEELTGQERAREDELVAKGTDPSIVARMKAQFAELRATAGAGVLARIEPETAAMIANAKAKFAATLSALRAGLDDAAAKAAAEADAITMDRFAAAAAQARQETDARYRQLVQQGIPTGEAQNRANEETQAKLDKIDAERRKAIADYVRDATRATQDAAAAAAALDASRLSGAAARAALTGSRLSEIDRVAKEQEVRAAEILAERAASAASAQAEFERRVEDLRRSGLGSPETEAAERERLAQRLAQIDAATAQKQADAAQDAGAKRVAITGDVASKIAQIELDANAKLLGLTKTGSEQRLAELDARYAREVQKLREKGATEAEIARVNALRVREAEEIRNPSTLSGRRALAGERSDAVLNNPNASFSEGAAAAALRIQSQIKSSAEIGADATTALSNAFVQLGDNATSGSMKAGAALKRFAVDAVDSLRRIAVQQLALQVFGSIFGAATGGGTAVGGGGSTASGGQLPTTNVGGYEYMNTNPYRSFAEGGVASTPSIFGERGPEAAVPLSRGRSIPVELRGKSAGGGQVHIHHHHTWNVNALDPRSMAAVLSESQDVVAALTADSLSRNARLRQAVKDAGR